MFKKVYWMIMVVMQLLNAAFAAGTDNAVIAQLRQAFDTQTASQKTSLPSTAQTIVQNDQPTDQANPIFNQSQPQNQAPNQIQDQSQNQVPDQTQNQTPNQTSAPQTPATPNQAAVQIPPVDAVAATSIPNDLREAAFQKLVNQYMPLTPEQVIRLRKIFNESQEAASTWPGTPPKPVASSIVANLAPGSAPPAIRLASGFVTSVVFIDATGAPWPIERYDLGNPRAYDIKWNQRDNTLMIQAISLYKYGNLAVKLKDLNTPVVLSLIPENKEFDYRVDLRIPQLGPQAKPLPISDGLPATESPALLNFLDGVPPPGSTVLTLDGGAGQAWLYGDKLYLRTRMTVVSPSWLATMSSADGMNVYEMMSTPMILASLHGKLVHLKVGGL